METTHAESFLLHRNLILKHNIYIYKNIYTLPNINMAMEDCILALYYKSHLMIKILGFVL